MNPAEAEALGRRWLSAGGEWRDGMLTQHGERVLSLAPPTERPRLYVADPCPESRPPWDILTVRTDDGGPRVPDLRDPATRGAALEVVRERWGDPTSHTSFDSLRGWVYAGKIDCTDAFPSEAEAIVAALEAAPKVTP